MMCQDYLDALVEGLSGAEVPQADEHERECARCRERGATMRTALTGIAALPAGTPAGFARGAMARVEHASAPWEKAAQPLWERITEWLTPRLAPLAFGAAAVALVTVGALRMGTHGPVSVAQVATLQSGTPGVVLTPAPGAVAVTVPEHGDARLAMGEVATMDLAGATDARIVGSARVELKTGSGTFDVNHALVGPEGFTIVTPHAIVRVTGTQFGVKVSGTETTVEVYSGHVELASATVPSQPPLQLNPGDRARSTELALFLVKSQRPTWAMPGVTAPAEAPASVALRPPAPGGVGNASGVKSIEQPFGGAATVELKGEPQPGVAANANVHQPFHP